MVVEAITVTVSALAAEVHGGLSFSCFSVGVETGEIMEAAGRTCFLISFRNVDEGLSHERGRSSVTGRYISRSSDMNYSGHSIDDRAIAAIERLYDNAQSQHEKERLDSIIRRIRTDEL